MEERDELVLVDREAVAVGLLLEGLDDPLLPVDEGPVDVERDPLDVLGKRHEGGAFYEGGRALASPPSHGPSRVPGQAALRAPRRSGPQGSSGQDRRRRRQRRRRDRLPLRRQGAGARSVGAARPAASRSPRTATRRSEHAEAILGMDIRGFTVHEVWIEAASDIDEEYYASIVFDRSAKAPLFMLSTQGGMDIEEVAERDPKAIARLHVDPLLGLPGLPRARARLRGRRRRRRRAADRRAARQALRRVRRRGRDARRGQPAHRHQGPQGRRARREGDARRQRAVPPPRPRRPAATARRRTRRRRWRASAG